MDGIMGGNDGGDVAVAVAANAVPGGGGNGGGAGGERRGSMVIRVQMLDDSISLFQVQVRRKEERERNAAKNVSSGVLLWNAREWERNLLHSATVLKVLRCSLSRSSGPRHSNFGLLSRPWNPRIVSKRRCGSGAPAEIVFLSRFFRELKVKLLWSLLRNAAMLRDWGLDGFKESTTATAFLSKSI